MKAVLFLSIGLLAACSSPEERERAARAEKLPAELASSLESSRTVSVSAEDLGAELRLDIAEGGNSLRLTPTAKSATRQGESVSIKFEKFEPLSLDPRTRDSLQMELHDGTTMSIRPIENLHWGEVFFAGEASALELEISKPR